MIYAAMILGVLYLGYTIGKWSEEYDWVHGYKDFGSVYRREK